MGIEIKSAPWHSLFFTASTTCTYSRCIWTLALRRNSGIRDDSRYLDAMQKRRGGLAHKSRVSIPHKNSHANIDIALRRCAENSRNTNLHMIFHDVDFYFVKTAI